MQQKTHDKTINVAILGSGKIGIDLLIKSMRSIHLNCILVAGRSMKSEGICRAKELDVNVSDQGIDAVLGMAKEINLLFDATSAVAHIKHLSLLKDQNLSIIDLTPSKVGISIVPAVNLDKVSQFKNINMISCGGQASIPLAYAVSEVEPKISYIEVVSSISSKSAGAATRLNLDEYIDATENALIEFSSCEKSKVLLILNPAEPPVNMQTTISFVIESPNMELINEAVQKQVALIQQYVPGYSLVIPPTLVETNRVIIMTKVIGLGDYLPPYAGNLDIINCAAIAVAEKYASLSQNKNSDLILGTRR